MDTVTFHIMWTIALFILFIGIILWAWSSKRNVEFDELASLPLDEEEFAIQVEKNTSGGKHNA